MDILISSIAVVAVIVGAAFLFAPARSIETRVRIDAAPGAVWAVLANGSAYGEWNPFIVSMEGEIVEGATLTNVLQPANAKAMTFRPTVLKAAHGEELRWLGRLFVPRLFDGEHYFLLESEENQTVLRHGENFRGVALWFMDVGQFRANFEAMNAALKARVESLER